MAHPFWLILVVWGDRYGDAYINEMASRVFDRSPDCDRIVLLTDRFRRGVKPSVVQNMIPEEFSHPDLFKGGYPAKLSLFTCPGAPDDMRCLYLDIDTVVMGDVGRIAADLRSPGEMLMLKAGTMGFNALARLRHRLTGGRRFSTGNSSVLAFTAARGRALAAHYLELRRDPTTHGQRRMRIDDVFISWFAAQTLRAVSPGHAVVFRREFMSRVPGFARLKGRLPWVRKRRADLVAVTLNGLEFKPGALLALPDGATLREDKGRTGRWSRHDMGPAIDAISVYCLRITQQSPPSEKP